MAITENCFVERYYHGTFAPAFVTNELRSKETKVRLERNAAAFACVRVHTAFIQVFAWTDFISTIFTLSLYLS